MYAYCQNNPVMYVDPSGYILETLVIIGVIIIISLVIYSTADPEPKMEEATANIGVFKADIGYNSRVNEGIDGVSFSKDSISIGGSHTVHNLYINYYLFNQHMGDINVNISKFSLQGGLKERKFFGEALVDLVEVEYNSPKINLGLLKIDFSLSKSIGVEGTFKITREKDRIKIKGKFVPVIGGGFELNIGW